MGTFHYAGTTFSVEDAALEHIRRAVLAQVAQGHVFSLELVDELGVTHSYLLGPAIPVHFTVGVLEDGAVQGAVVQALSKSVQLTGGRMIGAIGSASPEEADALITGARQPDPPERTPSREGPSALPISDLT